MASSASTITAFECYFIPAESPGHHDQIRRGSERALPTQTRRATKQGSNLVRWAAIEAVVRYHGGAPIAPTYARIAVRRGAMIARVAAARKLLCLVYYGLRDGEIRCLAEASA